MNRNYDYEQCPDYDRYGSTDYVATYNAMYDLTYNICKRVSQYLDEPTALENDINEMFVLIRTGKVKDYKEMLRLMNSTTANPEHTAIVTAVFDYFENKESYI